MKKAILILILALISLNSNAQNRNYYEQMLDSIRYYKKNQKPNLLLGFDNRVTFLGSKSAKVNGIRIGVNYQKFSYFLGLYGTRRDIISSSLINQTQFIPDTQLQKLRLGYFSFGFTYSHWAGKHWYFETTGQFGLGNAEREVFENSILVKKETLPTLPVEINGKAFYMITSWVGIGAGLGMRKALATNSQFDGLFYSTGVKLFLGQFYREVIKKKE